MGIFSKLPIFGDESVARGTRKAMINSYEKAKKYYPGYSEEDWMKTALSRRFRNWNDIELESFLLDCKNINELIDKIILQEKLRVI
tara:strand:- start:851 stop:1108 length:258 start_codon:yes stop_codon:yes gene_type:complete